MIRKELLVFLVVGTLTVLVDYACYNLLRWVPSMPVAVAKGLGFLAGTVFAYFANKAWTFGHAPAQAGSAARFALLYASTLAANVAINGAVLHGLGDSPWIRQVAFVAATGVSAALNFAGMKFFVFKTSSAQRVAT